MYEDQVNLTFNVCSYDWSVGIGALGRFLRSPDALEGDYEVRTPPALRSH